MNSTHTMINASRRWIEDVVIAHNFCPFAKRVIIDNSIYYHVCEESKTEDQLYALIQECARLDTSDTIETTLIIYPALADSFEDFLDLLAMAEALMSEQGYEGIYQLASFHPHYRFADADENDPANYTNRSPYPMLHLLREHSIEKALQQYAQAEQIPYTNIETARKLGLEKLQAGLLACYDMTNEKGKRR